MEVHGKPAKIMWDNGISAALVTNTFVNRAGREGYMVSYWLSVVGHDKVLRNTTLYILFLEDNSGRWHRVLAYGIDVISEDSALLYLTGVRSSSLELQLKCLHDQMGP